MVLMFFLLEHQVTIFAAYYICLDIFLSKIRMCIYEASLNTIHFIPSETGASYFLKHQIPMLHQGRLEKFSHRIQVSTDFLSIILSQDCRVVTS